jgi:hypothetical protein
MAAPKSVGNGQGPMEWIDGACFISQGFMLRAPALEPTALLQHLDAHVLDCTRAGALGALRWEGGDLMLGPACVLSLGALEPCMIAGCAAAAVRAILGGLSVQRGGRLRYDLRLQGGDVWLRVSLLGLRPRLPRMLFSITQAQVHQAVVRRAVRELAAEQTVQ